MLKQLIQVWRNNHGPILFVSGFLVAICMSVLWRFNMIPDIGPALRASPRLMGDRTKPAPNIVVVSITSEDAPDAEITLQFFAPPEFANETLTPLETRKERLDDGIAEFLLTDLARGTFAAIAYIDANENMQLDISEEGIPTEPYAFASSKRANDASAQAKGVFEVGNEPTFIKFTIKAPLAAQAQRPEQSVLPANKLKPAPQTSPPATPRNGSEDSSPTRGRTKL